MQTSLFSKIFQRFSFALVFLSLTACATIPTHIAVPETKVEQTKIAGFPAYIRFWADEAPPNLGPLIAERLASYRKANEAYYKKHKAYPELHYIAISGGANDGAFGAGFLNGWTKAGTRPEFSLVTGVSTGALIAPFVFIGSDYDATLKNLFTTTNSDNIFMASALGIFKGLTGGLALTDSSPLAKRIEESVTEDIMKKIAVEHSKGKRLFIGTTNIEAQRGVIWDIGAIASSGNPDSLKLIHKVLLASASIPGAFSPVFINVEVDGKHYSEIHADGGVTSQVFIYPLKIKRSVIDEFLRYHLKRHLYVIRNGKVNPEYESLDPGFFALSKRSIETLTKYQGLGDLYRLYIGTQRDEIDYNLIYIPADFEAESKEIFDPEYMSKLFELGYKMGQTPNVWLKKPPGVDYVSE